MGGGKDGLGEVVDGESAARGGGVGGFSLEHIDEAAGGVGVGLRIGDRLEVVLTSDPDFAIADEEVRIVEDNVEVFAEVVGMAEEAHGERDVAGEEGVDGAGDGDSRGAVIDVGVDFEGLKSGEVEDGIDFVAAGVAEITSGVLGGIVAPGVGEGLELEPVFGVVKRNGADAAMASGVDFAVESPEAGPEAALIADHELRGARL